MRGGRLDPVETERLHLRGKPLFVSIGLLSPLNRSVKRVERKRQTLDRGIDCAFLSHRL